RGAGDAGKDSEGPRVAREAVWAAKRAGDPMAGSDPGASAMGGRGRGGDRDRPRRDRVGACRRRWRDGAAPARRGSPMMRLLKFRYYAPTTVAEAAAILEGEGPRAMVVAGGTDLYPNMKRRHQMPATLVGLRKIARLRGVKGSAARGLSIGPGTTLTELEEHPLLRRHYAGLFQAIHSISTPILRNMGTIGGNICLDTRCNYYDQNYEWRRAINFCMKCDGTVCWVAPGSDV